MKGLNNIQAYWRRRGELPAPETLFQDMGHWWETPLGSALLDRETALLEPILARLFGYHFLQLGVSQRSMLEASPIGHKMLFAPSVESGTVLPVASNEALPLQSESVDAVLIHHALDFTPDSHRLLRESARVLMPGGKLLIIGFNPLSVWGLRHLLRWRNTLPWNARYIASSRVQDWLKLLEFTVDKVEHAGYLLPMRHTRFVEGATKLEALGQRFNAPLGAIYLIVACKQVMPVTPILPRWRPSLPRPVLVRPVGESVRARPQAARVKVKS
ncbi:MAG: class I SAM-dependent methyltransferase [Pseudomonadales bacterium]|nr:class I SAM-dependent methyltransferase [Pseudomonadales bacterium]MCP5357212.1 class I SAM-dependent methyltransferase [Pseudomonadales bacterium]